MQQEKIKVVPFKSIRQKIGRYILQRQLRHFKRTKSLFNFETAQHIGVVFKTDVQSDFELVKRFLHFLSDHNNKVVALCFVDFNKVPDYYLLRKGFNFFSRNDLNFYFVPQTSFINDFIEKPFDILIDLSTDFNFPLHYISSLSKAKYKIARQQQGNTCFDLMIDISKNNNVEALIEHIKHYVPVLCAEQS